MQGIGGAFSGIEAIVFFLDFLPILLYTILRKI